VEVCVSLLDRENAAVTGFNDELKRSASDEMLIGDSLIDEASVTVPSDLSLLEVASLSSLEVESTDDCETCRISIGIVPAIDLAVYT